MTTLQARNEGRRAYDRGLSKEKDNPYEAGTARWIDFRIGYELAASKDDEVETEDDLPDFDDDDESDDDHGIGKLT